MAREPGHIPATGELGLFAATEKRRQPRDRFGRFVAVHYTRHWLNVLSVAREMRRQMGLPASPILDPMGEDRG